MYLRNKCLLIAAAWALSASAAVAAPKPVELARVGRWEVNYDTDSCHLLGRFGEGDGQLILNLTRFQPGDLLDLRLYGKPLKIGGQFYKVSVNFGSDHTIHPSRGLTGTSGDMPMVAFGPQRLDDWSTDAVDEVGPRLDPAVEAAVTSLTVMAPGPKWFRLQLGSMARPMALMRECSWDLVKSWGYDPAVQSSLQAAPKPKASPAKWLSREEWPHKNLDQGTNGVIQFRLDIDEQGAVASCHILAQAGDSEFAKKTCNAMTLRAQFAPARDSTGKAVRSYYVNTVNWLSLGG